MKRVMLVLAMLDATRALAGHCHETSKVVGHEVCLSFGDRWGHFRMEGLELSAMDSAIVFGHVALSPFDRSGTVSSATGSAAYRTVAAPGTRSTMWTAGYRTGLRWHGTHAIAGLEFAGGGAIVSPTLVTTVVGNVPLASSGGSVMDFAGYGGAHTRIGVLDFSTLLVIGGRYIEADLAFPDAYNNCGGTRAAPCVASVDQLLVEARGGVDVWIGRHVTVGVSAGIDLAARAESLALELHVHVSRFDGS